MNLYHLFYWHTKNQANGCWDTLRVYQWKERYLHIYFLLHILNLLLMEELEDFAKTQIEGNMKMVERTQHRHVKQDWVYKTISLAPWDVDAKLWFNRRYFTRGNDHGKGNMEGAEGDWESDQNQQINAILTLREWEGEKSFEGSILDSLQPKYGSEAKSLGSPWAKNDNNLLISPNTHIQISNRKSLLKSIQVSENIFIYWFVWIRVQKKCPLTTFVFLFLKNVLKLLGEIRN